MSTASNFGFSETESPVQAGRELTYIAAISEAMREEMRRDPDVLLMGEDIAGDFGGAFKATKGFEAEFGARRVINTPIAELGFVGAATGMALMGLRPIIEMQFADFISTAFDSIVQFAATTHYRWGGAVPWVIRAPSDGGIRSGPYHSQNPEAWFVHTPGLKVVAPATPADAKGLLLASIRDDNPVIFLEHKALYRIKGDVPEGYYTTPLRKAVVERAGSDVTVVATMKMVHEALAAATELEKEGIDVEVVDLRTIRPYDAETVLESVRKTGRAVVASEAPKIGGLAAELSATIGEECFHDLKAPVLRVAGLDTPIPFSLVLEKYILPGKEQVIAGICSVMK
ncbi:MAG: alpha-ketoacid dehydrogenase subunit beta [Caldilineaceae bacterium]|nr:alpha-ketoacid dehydrogenase subunit beta [Caldilineaceae bacterium]